jgi:hypothetical protein
VLGVHAWRKKWCPWLSRYWAETYKSTKKSYYYKLEVSLNLHVKLFMILSGHFQK